MTISCEGVVRLLRRQCVGWGQGKRRKYFNGYDSHGYATPGLPVVWTIYSSQRGLRLEAPVVERGTKGNGEDVALAETDLHAEE